MIQNGTYYLNNHGSKWVVFKDGRRIQVKVNPDKYNGLQEPIIRRVIYFESFGNFVSALVSIKGKRVSTLNYEVHEKRPN